MVCLATFNTTSMALMFERAGRKEGFDVKIIPVPRKLSSSCGFACEFSCDSTEDIKNFCESRKIEYEALHQI